MVDTEKRGTNLVFAGGIRSNIVRFGMGGFTDNHQKKLWIEIIGTNTGSAARTIKPDEIIELRDYLNKIIKHNDEIVK